MNKFLGTLVLTTLCSTPLSPAEFVAMGGVPEPTNENSIEIFTGDDGTSVIDPLGNPSHDATIRSVSWNKRAGNLLAAGGNNFAPGTNFAIYQFNSVNGELFELSQGHFLNGVNTLKWSPDGKHLAVGGAQLEAGTLKVFELCGNTMREVASNDNSSSPIVSLDWSPDGKHIVTIGEGGGQNAVQAFRFTGNSLELKASFGLNLSTPNSSVSWSCDNKHIAIGFTDGGLTGHLQIRAFTGNSLQFVDDVPTPLQVGAVDWSCDGTFVAVGQQAARLDVFSFDGNTLSIADGTVVGASDIRSLAWYPNGRRIAIGLGIRVQANDFNPDTLSLEPVPVWFDIHTRVVNSVDVTCCLPAFCEEEV